MTREDLQIYHTNMNDVALSWASLQFAAIG